MLMRVLYQLVTIINFNIAIQVHQLMKLYLIYSTTFFAKQTFPDILQI